MPNNINNIKDVGGVIAKAAAKMFTDNLQFGKSVSVADASDFDGKNGYKAGQEVYVNLPMRSIPTSAFDQTSTIQDVVEGKAALPLDIISSSAFSVNSLEFATEIGVKDIMSRIIKPAMNDLAHDFEAKLLAKATQATFNSVGTPGTNTFDTDAILAAREVLGRNLCPRDDERYFLFNGAAGRKAVNARKGLFQSSSEIAKQYKMGYIGMADGFNWIESEMVRTHTNGNDIVFEVRTTVTDEGATSLVVEGLTTTTGTVKKGTVFTIAGVYAVHPITKEAYPDLQQFVVTDDETADSNGYATLSVSPAMYTSASKGLQNITAFPADGAAITPVGAVSQVARQNLAFHKDAFRLVTVPLVLPKNAEFAGQYNHEGINVAVVYDWDQVKREMVLRVDVLGGLANVRPEWSCRLPN